MPLLGGAGAALLGGFFMPMALGHAADGPYETCDGAVCLVQDSDLADWHYTGLRPFVTDWIGTQPYSVQVTQDDGSTIDVGSYSISAQDVWTPFSMYSYYRYGDFTPSPEAGDDPDLGGFAGMTGASIFDVSYLGGTVRELILSNVDVHGHELNYYSTTLGDFTNTTVWDPVHNTAADYIQIGDSAPQFLFNGLFHGDRLPTVPDYLVPADQFAQVDFDPGQFLESGAGL
jgi:hypothetical protein